ncbi:MAG TPA: hypothetical protein DEQ20_05905 [Desulfobulbaceae bacterium]|nr:MAG: hypothetical protein A2520_06880 [Deltaproteobacteria bacterium RIFOXYD12_FULL_53_23]HCC54443.1 hypothetical protein [Desulfobulbaceae bacterium]
MESCGPTKARAIRFLLGCGLALCFLLGQASSGFALEVIVDDATTTDGSARGFWMNTSGRWTTQANGSAQGASHRYNNNNNPREVRWYPYLAAGSYQVSIRYISAAGRATALPVKVRYNNGASTANYSLNQTAGGGAWVVLGTYSFVGGGNEYVHFTKANDATTASADAARFVQVVVNTAPVAVADSISVVAGGTATSLTTGSTSVLANDSDAQADPLTAILVSGVSHGSLSLNGAGTFSYTHNGDAATADSFTYKANDGAFDSNVVTVSIGIVHPVHEVSSHTNSEFTSVPINLTSSAAPQVMIASSNDHQLFFKAFNDYSDLDDDGTVDTTYKHSISYYGYFDSGKCYNYSVANQRFEPAALADADNYCTGANDTYWSGNFLNWASMARIDVINKILFGGHRRVDTAADTVLERAYLPHDAHSFAKYYDGADLAKLTPFTLDNTGTSASANVVSSLAKSTSSVALVGSGNVSFIISGAGVINNGDFVVAQPTSDSTKFMQGNATVAGSTVTINVSSSAGAGTYSSWNLFPRKSFAYSGGTWVNNDWVRVERTSNPAIFMQGQVTVSGGTIYLYVREAVGTTTSSYSDWSIVHLQKSGITLCNTTDVNGNTYSQDVTEPPLIKVVRGNYSLWAGNERWQCTWDSGASYDNHSASNGNDPASSGNHAYASSPVYASGLGQKNYVARVQACVAALLGNEKCKQYPSGNYKPIGLLQVYGDDDQMFFGMLAGTYNKHVSGGEVIRNIGSMSDEINVSTDGIFKKVAVAAGGAMANNQAEGLVNAWSLYRVTGYYHGDGTYNNTGSGDNCSWGLAADFSSSDPVMSDSKCRNWGNPFAEIFYQSIRYFADGGVNGVFRSSSATGITGLPTPLPWIDPLDTTNYCARLSVVNLNSSVLSYDADELDGASYGVQTIWDNADLPGDKTSKAMTDVVGAGEGIHGHQYFIGEVSGSTNGVCTAKTISSLGDALGLCPELPRLRGSYRIAGLAHYAKTKDIRPASASGGRALTGKQAIDSYAVAMASSTPSLEIPHPITGEKAVTILPACRNTSLTPNGNCAIVEFKIVSQTANNGGGIGQGKVYVNWEDSEQGGDFDQDMWGILEYTINANTNTIEVSTDVIAQSTGYSMAFGYVISGTSQDGFHAHSGINSYTYNDPATIVSGSGCAAGCLVGGAVSTARYTLGAASAGLLNDPLWYAAKWGNFTDSDGSGTPNLTSEWDRLNNLTGELTPDGIPDAYFYANNPANLEASLNRVFLSILQRSSSGTAAAVVANNVSGVGALYQAYYEPMRQDTLGNKATWIGTIQGLWLDSYGYIREDSGVAAQLENYLIDQVIQFYYDDAENKTRARRYISTKADEFAPYSMTGTVTAYDPVTGIVTLNLTEASGAIGSGPFSDWTVYNLTTGASGTSSTVRTINDHGVDISAVLPTGAWINFGDSIMVAHFDYTVAELDEIRSLWNGRKKLSFTGADPTLQRSFASPASGAANGGRFIKTWIDSDGDGVVDAGEFIDLTATSINSSNYNFFDLTTEAETENLVDYIRGKEIAGYRNRTLDYDGDGVVEVMRLGDIVNSTPTVIGPPQEGFDLLYKDATYATFKSLYAKRRQVLYVGANDGMLHAFNGGFYDSTTRAFLAAGQKIDGSAASEHPLGAELWAYVPMNLLPHLKWLKGTDYGHVYYVDGKPKVFDAKIFTPSVDHPYGWGTLLVVGMRLGGGPMTVDTAGDGLVGDPTPNDNRTFRSAYLVMDISNPENEPSLLAEIQVPDGSYGTSYPAVAAVKGKAPDPDPNKWYLVFGSGPENLATAESTSTAKIYAFDLGEIASPASSTVAGVLPAGCTQVGAGGNGSTGSMKILSCDTGITASFVGDPIAVDWDLNYKAETVYFGLVGNKNATSGRVMRLGINEQSDLTFWSAPSTLLNTLQPVVVGVTPGKDETGQKWIYFGTGRFYVSVDQPTTATQSIYGVKETEVEVAKGSLADVSSVQVATSGDITGFGALNTFDALESSVVSGVYGGWYINLPPIEGTAGVAPATRVISPSALAGGVLFTTVYQPGLDACSGEGYSRLYGLYYKTGTAYPSPTVFGEESIAGVAYARSFVSLGRGFATSPSIHTGSGTGNKAVSIFTQLSTGTIIRTEASTVTGVRSGMESWIEVR